MPFRCFFSGQVESDSVSWCGFMEIDNCGLKCNEHFSQMDDFAMEEVLGVDM